MCNLFRTLKLCLIFFNEIPLKTLGTKSVYSILICCVVAATALAQEKLRPASPVIIDTFNGKLPFDVPIDFRKTYDPGTVIDYVGYFEYNNYGCPKKKLSEAQLASTIRYLRMMYPNAAEEELSFVASRGRVSTELGKMISEKAGKVNLDFQLPPLKPNARYGIVIVTRPDKRAIVKIAKLASLHDTARQAYYKAFNYNPSRDSSDCKKQRPLSFEGFKKFVKPEIVAFNSYADSMFKEIDSLRCSTIDQGAIAALLKILIECKSCRDSYKFLMVPDSLKQIVNTLRHLDDSAVYNTSISTGRLPLNASLGTKPPDSNEYFERLANREVSRASFNQLVEMTRIIKAVEPSLVLDQLHTELLALKNCELQLQSLYDSINARASRLTALLATNPFFSTISFVNGSTSIYDFDTRNAYSFTADFGLAYYGEDLNNQFSPYLGFHVNFRYVDRNIRWRDYPNKTLLHHLSFHVGTTLVSLKKDGRTDNFFNKAALLTGIGYRLGHVIRLTGGSMWFQRENPNPLVDDKKLAATPYVGVSFDLSVQTFMQGFNTFFK